MNDEILYLNIKEWIKSISFISTGTLFLYKIYNNQLIIEWTASDSSDIYYLQFSIPSFILPHIIDIADHVHYIDHDFSILNQSIEDTIKNIPLNRKILKNKRRNKITWKTTEKSINRIEEFFYSIFNPEKSNDKGILISLAKREYMFENNLSVIFYSSFLDPLIDIFHPKCNDHEKYISRFLFDIYIKNKTKDSDVNIMHLLERIMDQDVVEKIDYNIFNK